MDCRKQDWANELANKGLKLEIAQNQNRMELYDEQLPRGGKPLTTLAVLALILMCAVAAVGLVLHFADMIDGRPTAAVVMAGR